jgi:hypothetical protein
LNKIKENEIWPIPEEQLILEEQEVREISPSSQQSVPFARGIWKSTIKMLLCYLAISPARVRLCHDEGAELVLNIKEA